MPAPQLARGTIPGHDVHGHLMSLSDFVHQHGRRDTTTTRFAVASGTARMGLHPHRRPVQHKASAFASISTSTSTLPPLLAPTLQPQLPDTPAPPVVAKPARPRQLQGGAVDNAKRLLSGAVSAIVSRTFVAPLERVKLELVLRNTDKTHVLEVARDIFAAEGVRGFWKAHVINILRTTPYKVLGGHDIRDIRVLTTVIWQRLASTPSQAINYASYDFYKQQLARLTAAHGGEEKLGRFVAGALAGVVVQ